MFGYMLIPLDRKEVEVLPVKMTYWMTSVTERLSISGNTCLVTASKLLVKLSGKVTEEVAGGLNGADVKLGEDVNKE
ncbi:hypothetical protein FRB99_004675 [Tulasnella sp. 403]|nr:hypothetical protein FRB99_004675 [Tulasnella sp. 403]